MNWFIAFFAAIVLVILVFSAVYEQNKATLCGVGEVYIRGNCVMGHSVQ